MDSSEYTSLFNSAIEHLQQELIRLRTNRATPALIENIQVAAYEGAAPMALSQVASISVPEARQLMVEPWDKSIIAAAEKALQDSELGLAVASDGNVIRLTMPLMTDEIKQQVLKMLNAKLEDARVVLRKHRDKAKDEISKQEKAGDISEDEKFGAIETLDKSIKEYNDKVQELGDAKIAEIKG